jgi:tRNA threonylcarbamoyladenosine dehydratase
MAMKWIVLFWVLLFKLSIPNVTSAYVSSISGFKNTEYSQLQSARTNQHAFLHQLSEDDDHDEYDEIKTQRKLRFAGVGQLYSQDAKSLPSDGIESQDMIIERLNNSTVCVIGLGGVGSWAAEALCRSGVGNLILIDLDDICISNTNRQLHTTINSIGRMKIDEMQNRLKQINPQCTVINIHDFITETNVQQILDSILPDVDVVLDAIDSRQAKTALIAACVDRHISIVTCGGAAGKRDPTRIVSDDLARVNGDDLLSAVRRNLRKTYGFSEGKKFRELKGKLPKKWKIPAVYSTEDTSLSRGTTTAAAATERRRCDSGGLGSACFVTGTFGFVAAGRVVDMIARNEYVRPRKQ